MRFFIPILVSSFIFSQNIWNGISVATPDNLDAITTNPAGLGVERGEQTGTHIYIDSKYTNSSSYRNHGFGYDLTYNIHSHGIFKPEDGNIGFGFSPTKNLYTGMKWNKHSFIDLGLLYRPFNFISIGSIHNFSDDFENYYHSTLGVAIRPFFNHRLTIGADYNDANSGNLTYHFSSELIDGILISGSWNATTENDLQINLGFNLGKQTGYLSSNINTTNDTYSSGFGFYTDTQTSKSIFRNVKWEETKP